MRRILKLLCLFALCLVSVTPLWAETLTPAPLNPAFVEYQQQSMKSATSGETAYPTGRTPSPIDLSHLAGQSIVPDRAFKTATTYPESYDLRDEGYVSPIRNQSPYGACWTFAAMASMESTAMKLLGVESVDLAEWDLAYYGYTDESDELVAFGNYDADNFPGTANCGGDDFKATAILSRWTGPALESDVPYGTTPFPEGAAAAYHLSDVMFLYYDADSRYAPVSIENIKYALTTYGAVSVGVFAEDGWSSSLSPTSYFNLDTSAAYIPANNTDDLSVGCANHAVTIVGWNDNYSRSNFTIDPGQDGAWIVRNSWDTDWGNDGYFYLSYYDAVLDTGAAYISAPADNYDNIYQYDPLGLVGMQGIPNDLTPTSAWMANVFTAEGQQALTAVSFYAAAVDTSYEISIFTNVSAGDPTDGNLALFSQSGTLHVPGYRTVRLDDPVLLSAGQTFSVVININTPDYAYPLAMEYALCEGAYNYSGKATANPGESFFSSNGISWTDTTDEKPTANLCIKAFSYDTEDVTLLTVKETSSSDMLLFQQSETNLLTALESLDLEASMETVLFLESGSASGTGNWFPFAYPYSSDWDGTTRSYTLCLALNHSTDLYETPACAYGAGFSDGLSENRSASDTEEHVVLIEDGGPFDGDGIKNNAVSSVDLATLMVSSTLTEGSGSGGCNLGTFAPAALFLLVPLTFLKKK